MNGLAVTKERMSCIALAAYCGLPLRANAVESSLTHVCRVSDVRASLMPRCQSGSGEPRWRSIHWCGGQELRKRFRKRLSAFSITSPGASV
jgi:hypothetical protein